MTDFTKRALRRLSPIYGESHFAESFFDALSFDYEKLRGFISTLREQHFTQTVDWGIEYLERKYSLEPRRDLSLEERRARLGIKVARKLPLNPAVLEKHALDNFALNIFLDETDAGFIHLYLNRSNEFLGNYLDWLLNEKPAHLKLDARFIFIDFSGGDGEFNPSHVIKNPEEIIPQGVERSNFPRTFAGIAQTDVGLRTIDIARPRDIRQKIHACGVLYNSGVGLMSLALPRILMGNRHNQTVGQALIKSGDVTIDAWKGDLPKHDDLIESPITDLLIADVGIAREGEIKIPVEEYDRAYRTGFFIGTGSFIVGSKKLDLQRPRDVKQKFFASVGTGILGSVTIKTKPEIRKRSSFILRAGQSIYRAGSIRIDTSTKPSPPPEIRTFGRVDNINTFFGNALMRQGVERIELGTQRWNETYKILKRAGVAMIKSGTLRIESADDFFDVPEGEWLKLWFSFPTGASKIILLQNPRDDLTKAMIRQLGDFAAADEILINEKGDPTVGISRAALITERTRKIF